MEHKSTEEWIESSVTMKKFKKLTVTKQLELLQKFDKEKNLGNDKIIDKYNKKEKPKSETTNKTSNALKNEVKSIKKIFLIIFILILILSGIGIFLVIFIKPFNRWYFRISDQIENENINHQSKEVDNLSSSNDNSKNLTWKEKQILNEENLWKSISSKDISSPIPTKFDKYQYGTRKLFFQFNVFLQPLFVNLFECKSW